MKNQRLRRRQQLILIISAVLNPAPLLVNSFYLDPTARPQAVQNNKQILSPPVSSPTSESETKEDEEETNKSPFPSWPLPIVVSEGDYRQEAWIEKLVGGPLYEKQSVLPKLPIPNLQDTIERFLPTALPLANDKTEAEALQDACRIFPQQAQFLQERLIEYDQSQCSNASWLQYWWQTQGYLQVRNSLLQVSYFLFIPDDSKLPLDQNKTTNSTTNHPMIGRAAAAVTAILECRKQIGSGQMGFEKITETQPLCSTGFKYLFHACRVPQKIQDKYHLYDPSRFRHLIVCCQGRFFKVDVVDKNQQNPLPLHILMERLQRCVNMAHENAHKNDPQMGWLTTTNRDDWYKARQELLHTGGPVMEEALQNMESGAFVLCLDDNEKPTTMTNAANIYWKQSAKNRWFDKSFQIVCTGNGKLAYVGEHSMLDAAPTIPILKRIIKTTYSRLVAKQPDTVPSTTTISSNKDNYNDDDKGVTDIFAKCWSSSPELTALATKLTNAAKAHHEQLASEYECQVCEFTQYGKKFIKKAGFVCHDYVQQALQLAGYRYFRQMVGTYEAALTRTFLHGRTETARPVSPQSKAFVECMGLEANRDNDNGQKKWFLLKEAAAAHDEYQRAACSGRGVDRHFFGLSNMLRPGDKEPALLSDSLYLRSKNWKLSTSSVIFTPGFGPSTDDGIAVGYRVEADSCTFTCTSRSKNKAVKPFCKLLNEALTEMGDLVLQNDS